MRYLFLGLFAVFLTGCSVATDIYDAQQLRIKNEKINKLNDKKFEEYGACFVSFDANVSLELLKNRNLTKKIGNGINKYGNYTEGFWIYTQTDQANTKVEIATMNDILILPLEVGAQVMSKSKKLGAIISDKGNLSVGYFSKNKFDCLERNDFANVSLVSSKLLD
ncbi:hypothetical protein BTO23_15545 [Aliivibrio sifiae]|uniref:Lipoprotein n=1 Tax=Aliivibrio sifiae TaxID=566293 RepID=A0A2S7X822_9GAMM|nr:hypothetical protein BTO23_15545 [Aliivibrio sifiae]